MRRPVAGPLTSFFLANALVAAIVVGQSSWLWASLVFAFAFACRDSLE